MLKSFCNDLSTLAGRASRISARDVFCGFDEGTLPSLILRVLYADNSGDSPSIDNIVRACKESLLDLMPCDAVIRAESSIFAQDPDNEEEVQALVVRYFTKTYHAGLVDCMAHFWPNLFLLQDSAISDVTEPAAANRHDLLILTFTGYTTSVDKILHERGVATENIKNLNLINFNTVARLRDEVEAFWSDKDQHNVLLVQCSASLHAEHLEQLRLIMREFEAHFRSSGAATVLKEQAIILHLFRFAASAEWQFSCLSEWRQVVVDRLEGDAVDFELLKAARGTKHVIHLITIEEDEKLPLSSLRELIKEQLSWCLSRIEYPHRCPRETAAYTSAIVEDLCSHEAILTRIEDVLRRKLEENVGGQRGSWLVDLACDQGGLIKASNLTSSIIECIQAAVREPLALLLFELEKSSALASLQTIDSAEMEDMWLQLWLPEQQSLVLGIGAATELGFESLQLQTHATALKWAFSPHFAAEMLAHRSAVEDMCKIPETEEVDSSRVWDEERISTVKLGLCRHFVSDNSIQRTLRRLSEIVCPAAGTDEYAEAELSRALETLWMNNRESFVEDFIMTVADQIARDHTGLQLEKVQRVVRLALTAAFDHPADIVIRYWQTESVLRPLLQIYLLLTPAQQQLGSPATAASSVYDFATITIEEAAHFCLESWPVADGISTWLNRAQQLTNHALALQALLERAPTIHTYTDSTRNTYHAHYTLTLLIAGWKEHLLYIPTPTLRMLYSHLLPWS